MTTEPQSLAMYHSPRVRVAVRPLEFPAAALVLLVLTAVAAIALSAGTRWGLVWGFVAGFLAWGAVCSVALVCACIAHARIAD